MKRKESTHSEDPIYGESSSSTSPKVGDYEGGTKRPKGNYCEVFLSFRGEDTRKGFTNHLYNSLADAGIQVFRDDNELPVGEKIDLELLCSIAKSKISIPIISENYASSKWCLRELAEMLKYKRSNGQIVLPIFYKVEPSQVRHPTGKWRDAIDDHKTNMDKMVVKEWEEALEEVSSLKGWESEKIDNGKGIEVLSFMSLIKIDEEGKLMMHDQLRDLGREIVRLENRNEPQERSRLWIYEEALDVLDNNKGTRKIEALSLGECGQGRTYTAEQFKQMTNLRFLLADGANFTGDFKSLLPKLRWLQWLGCPSDFTATNFHPKKLVVLDLSCSAISEDWGGWVPLKMATELKVLNLGYCQPLRRTPDLTAFISLEILILECCENLEEIHPSIGNIKTLISLDVSYCKRLKELSAGIGRMVELRELRINDTDIKEIPISSGCLMKLETLRVSNCQRLSQLPKSMGSLVSLTLLDLSNSTIEELPEFIGSMKKLETLNASECRLLARIPNSIGNLASLQSLFLYACSSLTEIPDSIEKLASLTELSLRSTSITKLPESIGNMQNLRILDISNSTIMELPDAIGKLAKLQRLDAFLCEKLERLPSNICELVSLEELWLAQSGISSLPESISKLSSLQELDVGYCEKLRELPELPSGLTGLMITCQSPSLPHLSQLTHLKKLALFNCPWLERVPELPIGLSQLNIMDCRKLKAFTNVSNLKHLSELRLNNCFDLAEVTALEGSHCLSNLPAGQCLKISGVDGIEDSSTLMSPNASQLDGSLDLSDSKILQGTDAATSCANSVEIQDLGGSKSSQVSDILKCTSAGRLLDFSSLKYLRSLSVWGCNSVTEIQGLDGSDSLTRLTIGWCSSLRSVDLSNVKNLRHFYSQSCENLVEIRGLEGLGPSLVCDIYGCPSPRQSPDLFRLCESSAEATVGSAEVEGAGQRERERSCGASGGVSQTEVVLRDWEGGGFTESSLPLSIVPFLLRGAPKRSLLADFLADSSSSTSDFQN